MSQDDLALLKGMYERGEISDEQYDTLRRHVLWGTPLPQLADDPTPDAPAPPRRGGWDEGPPTQAWSPRPDWTPASPPPPARPAPARPASDRAGWDRAAQDRAGWDRAAQDRAGWDRAAQDRAAQDRAAQDRAGWDRAPQDRAGWDRAAQDRAAQDRAAQDRAAQDRAAQDRAAQDRAGGGRQWTGRAGEAPVAARRPADPPPFERGGAAFPIGGAAQAAPDRRAAAREAPPAGASRSRRRRAPKLLAALTSTVLALALVAAGVWWFVLRDTGVDAAVYARTVCSGVRDWQQVLDTRSGALVRSIAQQEDRGVVRSAVRTYYVGIAQRTDGLRTAVLDAGVADVPGGRAYADSLAAAVGEQAAGLRDRAGRAERLDVDSPTLFQISLQGLLTGAETAVSGVTAALARPSGGTPAPLRSALSNEPACAPFVG